jgi:hypothetical protein
MSSILCYFVLTHYQPELLTIVDKGAVPSVKLALLQNGIHLYCPDKTKTPVWSGLA